MYNFSPLTLIKSKKIANLIEDRPCKVVILSAFSQRECFSFYSAPQHSADTIMTSLLAWKSSLLPLDLCYGTIVIPTGPTVKRVQRQEIPPFFAFIGDGILDPACWGWRSSPTSFTLSTLSTGVPLPLHHLLSKTSEIYLPALSHVAHPPFSWLYPWNYSFTWVDSSSSFPSLMLNGTIVLSGLILTFAFLSYMVL
jgi:hypothetical protein